jgi:hypothetical protein
MLLLKVVDFRSRMLALRGACGEPTRRLATLNGLTCPADPAGQESLGSVTSHEENAVFIFEKCRTMLSNQLAKGGSFQK